MFQLFAIRRGRGGFVGRPPWDHPPQSAGRGQGPPRLDSSVWLGSTWGGWVFLTSQELTAGPETRTAGSDGGSRASPPAFCFIHAPPCCNIKPVYRAILDWPALPPPPQSERLAFRPASARSTLTAFVKTRPDDEAVNVFLHAGFYCLEEFASSCLHSDSRKWHRVVVFFPPSYSLMWRSCVKNRNIWWSRQKC